MTFLSWRVLAYFISMENWTKKGKCPEEIWCCSFLVWEISSRKGFWVVNTWQAPEQKRLKSTFSCASSFLTKVCPRFLTITYVFFIAILWRILKSDFENQKHNQRQIIKKNLKRKNADMLLFGSWWDAFLLENTLENKELIKSKKYIFTQLWA